MTTGANCAGCGPAIFAPTSPRRAGSVIARDLAAMEARLGTAPAAALPAAAGERQDRYIDIETPRRARGWTAAAAWRSSTPASRRTSRP